MYYIDPITTTDAQVLTGTTLAEDTTPAWAAGTFAQGDERHLVSTHLVYACAIAGSSTLSPDLDPTRWKAKRPTNKWAPFDGYTSTAATATVNITYVLACRFVNAVMLRGLVGKSATISIKDAPGGATIYPAKTFALQYAARGYYDYAFGTRKTNPTLLLTGLPIRSNAEMTITVSATGTNPRAIGLIARGKLRALHGSGFGGTQQDAEVSPKTYTYRKVNDDGTQVVLPRGSSKDLSLSVFLELTEADRAVQELEQLMSRPIVVIATTKPGYSGLAAVGFITKSPLIYKAGHAICNINVEGSI